MKPVLLILMIPVLIVILQSDSLTTIIVYVEQGHLIMESKKIAKLVIKNVFNALILIQLDVCNVIQLCIGLIQQLFQMLVPVRIATMI